jgi:cell division protein FtsB
MRRVRAEVAAKFDRGMYTREDLVELRRIEHGPRERADFGLAPADDIARLGSWDPLGPYTFASHRRGTGRIIVTAKAWLRRLAQPVAAVILARQAQFNGAVARLLTGAFHGVLSLEADNAALESRLDDLECRNQELHARCDKLQAEVRGLRSRLGPEGHEVKPG